MVRAHRIALLFNASKHFDREVMAGIAAHTANTPQRWDLFLEQDFRQRLDSFRDWHGDGIIADFDDPAVARALARNRLPVVAVGGSYQDERAYPPGVPYVATDNTKLVKLAFDQLAAAGLAHFAMYSLPPAMENRWAQEREQAFLRLDRNGVVFRGQATSAASWDAALAQQIEWLRSLPKPVGIIAVSDARARQLMQACALANIAVPQQVAVIGIDNDALAGLLTRIPMSSVIQGSQEIGRTAAHLLEQMLQGAQLPATRILVPPAGIKVLASSRHEPLEHPTISRALHFIRQHACNGIRSAQVADYVGVSQTTLASCFRRELGRSVHAEILRCRLDAAAAILERGERRLEDVAHECGFSSNQYLHAVFRRELGCSPREAARLSSSPRADDAQPYFPR